MTHWIVYWKTYWDEIDNPYDITPDWHSSYDHLYEDANPGDAIWVVISGGPDNENEWRLLERFTIRSKNNIGHSTGDFRYQFLGDEITHEVYDPKSPSDLMFILTSLNFATENPIQASGKQIGQSLQSPRKLNNLDAKKLEIFSEGLTRIK